MTNDRPSPAHHAQGWRLISRGTGTDQPWIDAGDANPALLLVLDTQGAWWAVAPDCRHCAAPLVNGLSKGTTDKGIDEIQCARCGVKHGPAIAACKCVALMVVDDEIYAAPAIDGRS